MPFRLIFVLEFVLAELAGILLLVLMLADGISRAQTDFEGLHILQFVEGLEFLWLLLATGTRVRRL